jgi:probable rRNA maturation factor
MMKKNINVVIQNTVQSPLKKVEIFELLNKLMTHLKIDGISINIIFTSDEELKLLNLNYRNKDQVTDILTFPVANNNFINQDVKSDDVIAGDIYIAVNHSFVRSKDKKISHELELKHLIVHGVLHLLNYSHDNDDDQLLIIEETILGINIHN